MLKVYDEPEALIISNGNKQLYISVDDFDLLDNLQDAQDFNRDADYVKKRANQIGDIVYMPEINPVNHMIISADTHETPHDYESYVYVASQSAWRHSESGVMVRNKEFNESFAFKILYMPREDA